MLVLRGLDCLKIHQLGGAGNFPHVCGVVLAGRSSWLVIFTTEDSQVGSPPKFAVMGRSGYWHVFFEESHLTVQRF